MNLFRKREENRKDYSIEEHFKTIGKELDDKQNILDEVMNKHEKELSDMFDKSSDSKLEEDWFDKMVEEEKNKQR